MFGLLGKAAKFGLGAGKAVGKAGMAMGKNLANPKKAMKPSSVTGPTMGALGGMFGRGKKKKPIAAAPNMGE